MDTWVGEGLEAARGLALAWQTNSYDRILESRRSGGDREHCRTPETGRPLS